MPGSGVVSWEKVFFFLMGHKSSTERGHLLIILLNLLIIIIIISYKANEKWLLFHTSELMLSVTCMVLYHNFHECIAAQQYLKTLFL